MTNTRENKLRMYYAVSAVCECNKEFWLDNEVFVADYKRFTSKIAKIESCQDQIKIENIFTETFKSYDRVELEELTFYLSGKLKLLAKETQNQDLLEQIQHNCDNISGYTDTDLIGVCNYLADQASVFIDQLASHDITIESIADLQRLTSSFYTNMNRSKYYQSKNKYQEDNLKRLFREMDELLRSKLDYDIEFYKNSNPLFYDQFKSARIILEIDTSAEQNNANLVNAIDD